MSFNKIKKALISWAADIRVYKGGIILFGDSHYNIKGHHEREILEVIQPGDVLLRRYDHYLGSITIPGYWSHAAIYIGNNEVIHMLGKGVTKEDILTFMRCDDITVLRHKDKECIQTAIEKAIDILEHKVAYDYAFDFNDESKMSCTEFVSICYDNPTFYERLMKNMIMPDDFLHSIFYTVWVKK